MNFVYGKGDTTNLDLARE
jgi:aarF domain-containing kinase